MVRGRGERRQLKGNRRRPKPKPCTEKTSRVFKRSQPCRFCVFVGFFPGPLSPLRRLRDRNGMAQQQRGTGKEGIWTRHASVIIRNAQKVRDGSHHNAVLVRRQAGRAPNKSSTTVAPRRCLPDRVLRLLVDAPNMVLHMQINKIHAYAAGYATASLNWTAMDVAAAAAQARCWFRAAEVRSGCAFVGLCPLPWNLLLDIIVVVLGQLDAFARAKGMSPAAGA